jgi:hypothetical protein
MMMMERERKRKNKNKKQRRKAAERGFVSSFRYIVRTWDEGKETKRGKKMKMAQSEKKRKKKKHMSRKKKNKERKRKKKKRRTVKRMQKSGQSALAWPSEMHNNRCSECTLRRAQGSTNGKERTEGGKEKKVKNETKNKEYGEQKSEKRNEEKGEGAERKKRKPNLLFH